MGDLNRFTNKFELYLSAFCLFAMVTILFAQVIARYIFNNAFAWAEEVALIFFTLTVYFGACGAVLRKNFLRVELLLGKLKPRTRKIMEIVSDLFFVLFNVIIMVNIIPLVTRLQANNTRFATTGLPKWLVYVFLPSLLFLMSIRLIQSCIIKLKELKSDTWTA